MVYQGYLRSFLDSSGDRGAGINPQNFEKEFDAYDAGSGFDASCTE